LHPLLSFFFNIKKLKQLVVKGTINQYANYSVWKLVIVMSSAYQRKQKTPILLYFFREKRYFCLKYDYGFF